MRGKIHKLSPYSRQSAPLDSVVALKGCWVPNPDPRRVGWRFYPPRLYALLFDPRLSPFLSVLSSPFPVLGSFYVLPSFFECLSALKDAEADFGVVFRTFGDDISEVSREFNAFCEGAHPMFPGVKMDGR